jgi:hypothetical protein
MQTLRIKNMFSRFSDVGRLWYDKAQQEGKTLYERNRKAAEDYKKQVEVAEQKAKEANVKLATELKKNIDKTKATTNANTEAITKYVTDDCKLSNAGVLLHDSASQNELPPSTIGTVTGTSNVKVPELLTTVTENYGTCYETREKLKAWQYWYKQQKQIFDSVK